MCFLTGRIMFLAWFSALISFGESSANVSTFCVQNLLLKYFQGLFRVHTKSWCLFSLAFSCDLKCSLSPVLLAIAAGAELVCTGEGRRKEREDSIGHQKGTALVAEQAGAHPDALQHSTQPSYLCLRFLFWLSFGLCLPKPLQCVAKVPEF